MPTAATSGIKCIQGFLPSEPNLLEETFDAISIMHWLQHEGGTFLDSRFGFPILPGRSWEPGGNPHVTPSNYQMEGENHYLTAGPGGHLEDIFLFKVILIDYYTMLNHHETEHHLGNYFFCPTTLSKSKKNYYHAKGRKLGGG